MANLGAPSLGERGVLIEGDVLLPPAVERERAGHPATRTVGHVDGSTVTEPRVVQRKFDDLNAPHRSVTRAALLGAQIIDTGSNWAIVRATSAWASSASLSSPRHNAWRVGEQSTVRS